MIHCVISTHLLAVLDCFCIKNQWVKQSWRERSPLHLLLKQSRWRCQIWGSSLRFELQWNRCLLLLQWSRSICLCWGYHVHLNKKEVTFMFGFTLETIRYPLAREHASPRQWLPKQWERSGVQQQLLWRKGSWVCVQQSSHQHKCILHSHLKERDQTRCTFRRDSRIYYLVCWSHQQNRLHLLVWRGSLCFPQLPQLLRHPNRRLKVTQDHLLRILLIPYHLSKCQQWMRYNEDQMLMDERWDWYRIGGGCNDFAEEIARS